MADRILRGSRLGAVSYESTQGRELAPRMLTSFLCPQGHQFDVPFSDEAEEVPVEWECRKCGRTAHRVDGTAPVAKVVKPARTHWDMLLERRSRAELEDVLAERLALLRKPVGKRSA